MIRSNNPELVIKHILKDVPKSQIGFYHYGNEYELKRVMEADNFGYPLVWYQLPQPSMNELNLLNSYAEGSHQMFIATRTKKEYFNDTRNAETFEKVLNPTFDLLMELFTKSVNLQIVDSKIKLDKLPNYYKKDLGTRETPQKRTVDDYWDVIRFSFEAIIKPIKCN